MNDRFLIRDIDLRDYEQWLSLWRGYNAFYDRSGENALSANITETTWARLFDAGEPVHGLVADQAGTLIGLTHYLFHRSTISVAPTCYLQDLFTVDEARGQGVGRALIEEVYGRARLAGSGRVYWQTHETNLTAMQLYDRLAERSGFLVYRKQL